MSDKKLTAERLEEIAANPEHPLAIELLDHIHSVEQELKEECCWRKDNHETATTFMNQVKKLQAQNDQLQRQNAELVGSLGQSIAVLNDIANLCKYRFDQDNLLLAGYCMRGSRIEADRLQTIIESAK